jgi:hypothetical protein
MRLASDALREVYLSLGDLEPYPMPSCLSS